MTVRHKVTSTVYHSLPKHLHKSHTSTHTNTHTPHTPTPHTHTTHSVQWPEKLPSTSRTEYSLHYYTPTTPGYNIEIHPHTSSDSGKSFDSRCQLFSYFTADHRSQPHSLHTFTPLCMLFNHMQYSRTHTTYISMMLCQYIPYSSHTHKHTHARTHTLIHRCHCA